MSKKSNGKKSSGQTVKSAHAPRKITGKHGRSLRWFENQYRKKIGDPISKSQKRKALREYKAQKVA